MVHDPSWRQQAPARPRPRTASSIACLLFVLGMAAAFWLGAIWASQAWLGW